jgi:hypothetical protein
VFGTSTEGFTTPDLVDAAAQLNSLAGPQMNAYLKSIAPPKRQGSGSMPNA